MSSARPFAAHEFLIAWRYIRARRAEGGVSTMTWISLIGITLAVFALVATLAVRTGLRAETVRTILGASAHVEVYYSPVLTEGNVRDSQIRDYDRLTEALRGVDGVESAVPIVVGQVIGNLGDRNAPVEIHGITPEDLALFPAITEAEEAVGDLARLPEGIALSQGVARQLGAVIGDRVQIISPNGARTAFGTTPRRSAYEVVYIFKSGSIFVDRTRAYLPLDAAQVFFDRDGAADQVDLTLTSPEAITPVLTSELLQAGGERAYLWTWENRAGGYLRALRLQDNAIYILLAILVLIASMNIVSGLIMLVKNKGRDIGILRTMGLDRAAVLRVFFLVGASIGTIGTLCGVALGVVFSLNIEHVYAFVNSVSGGMIDVTEADGFFFPPAELTWPDVLGAMALSLGLSWGITYFPARRAAAMNPVEALRYE